ncbi:MAG: hypothetical protein LBQ16_06960 [Gracilibacteraceae bacterium]|jgi:hypothetical protein|nr:hypothetical protein [Gracilibacteraceae bacterium]
MIEKKSVGGLSVGGSSILVIFVVLSLTIFAALSFMSAQADLRLAEKQAQAAREYYAADSAATERLAEIDARLRALVSAGSPLAGAPSFAQAAAAALGGMEGISLELDPDRTLRVGFDMPLNERQVLRVALRVPAAPGEEAWPAPEGEGRYRVTAWQVVNTKEWEGGQDPILVWDGE